MSFQVTDAHVRQFSSNVFHLSQQKGSRIRGSVRNESQVGERAFYDRIGKVAAIKRTGRHTDTPRLDTPHSRRAVDLVDYEWGDMVDDQDKIRMLMDPTSMYAQAAAWALGRSMDEVIIDSLDAPALTGKEGSGTIAELDFANDSNDIVACTDGAALSSLNVLTLRRIKRRLDEKESDENMARYMLVNAKMLESLLSETEVTSSDYNTVKALVQGQLDSFMGFNFIRTELLRSVSESDAKLTAAGSGYTSAALQFSLSSGAIDGAGSSPTAGGGIDYRVGFAWAQDGLLLSIGQDITGEIARRPDKSFSTQVYAKMGIGGVRMEEEKVVKFIAQEA